MGTILLLLSAVYGLAVGSVSCALGAAVGACTFPCAVGVGCFSLFTPNDGRYGGKALESAMGKLQLVLLE